MVHPEVKRGWHEIRAQMPPENGEVYLMQIGKFDSDKQYHLLGYRPKEGACYFSAESESNQDLGIVQLPEGRERLSKLESGEIFTVASENGERFEVKYLGHHN